MTNKTAMDINKDSSKYNAIERYYMERVHDSIMSWFKYFSSGAVLDFGAGRGMLKKRYPSYPIESYDVVKEFSDVEDYRQSNYSVVICCHVLEHLDDTEIRDTLKSFKTRFLIVASPTENWLSKLAGIFCQIDPHEGHKVGYERINELCEEEFYLIARYRVFTMTEISVYSRRQICGVKGNG